MNSMHKNLCLMPLGGYYALVFTCDTQSFTNFLKSNAKLNTTLFPATLQQKSTNQNYPVKTKK